MVVTRLGCTMSPMPLTSFSPWSPTVLFDPNTTTTTTIEPGATTTVDPDEANAGTATEQATADEPKFTQADMDAAITKRLARDRAKLEADLKTLKERSELDEVARLKAELADRDTALSAKDRDVLAAKVGTAAERAAVTAGVKADRLERFMAIASIDDLDALTADGKPDTAAITALINKTLADWPEFKGGKATTTTGTDLSENGGPGGTKVWTRAEVDKMSVEEFAKHEDEITTQMRAGLIK